MRTLLLTLAMGLSLFSTSVRAETGSCTPIKAIPITITEQGVYCFTGNLGSTATTGSAIDIQANNVTIDLNGYKLGGKGAGETTKAIGIYANNRVNITIRHGNILGFNTGVQLDGVQSSGHIVENLLLEKSKSYGVWVAGANHIIRNNRILETGTNPVIDRQTVGITVNSSNTVVANNVISKTSSTSQAFGIMVSDTAELVELRGNSILDSFKAPSGVGIWVGGKDVTIINNRVLNATSRTGLYGIIDARQSNSVSCIDNVISGFTTTMRCGFTSGNHEVPLK